jgi:hypothetical protein
MSGSARETFSFSFLCSDLGGVNNYLLIFNYGILSSKILNEKKNGKVIPRVCLDVSRGLGIW